MTDYKELITEIRNCFPTNLERRAADAIEQLVKERDAAILDKKRLERAVGKAIPKTCKSCQLWGTNGWSQYQVGYCEGDENPHSANDFCSRWRGVKEVDHEAD